MSRKNHKMIDGRLLQTNKKYSQLKMKQKEKIAEWMFQATRDYYMKKCTFPSDKHLEEVVDSVYEKIEDAEKARKDAEDRFFKPIIDKYKKD